VADSDEGAEDPTKAAVNNDSKRHATGPRAWRVSETSGRTRPARGSAKTEVIFGKHSVRAVFRARPESIHRVILREAAAHYLQEFIDASHEAGIEPELLRSGEFLRLGGLSEDDKHQGVFVIADKLKIHSEYDFDLLGNASVVVVLDQVSNPQNFGTIIRTAAFFGADGVVWLKNRAVDIDSTVSRVAVGGTEFVKLFRVTNLARSLELLKERGFWVYGLDERGDKTLAETEFDAKTVVIIGAEGQGLRQRTKLYCDELVRIPGGQPGLEDLNAAVAAGIVLAEVASNRRQVPTAENAVS
jgi:23S rRNA (guanosine2251-2'-O)-methyltransferase